MKATIARFDAYYEVAFSRPAFSRLGSFAQIIEPIHDALSSEALVPSDAIRLENGNTIATAVVTVTLFSGNGTLEARLDGYKSHFLDLRSSEDIDKAKRCAMLFEGAASEFLSDGVPATWRLVMPSWFIVDGGIDAAEELVRSLTWLPGNEDPFAIGATKTLSHVKFECLNAEQSWVIGLTVDKSVLPGADLFLEVSSGYTPGSHYDTFEKKMDHIAAVSRSICNTLGLIVD